MTNQTSGGSHVRPAPREKKIKPGDRVEHRTKDLDPREVISVGIDFLTLDILGKESPRLPLDNYRKIEVVDP